MDADAAFGVIFTTHTLRWIHLYIFPIEYWNEESLFHIPPYFDGPIQSILDLFALKEVDLLTYVLKSALPKPLYRLFGLMNLTCIFFRLFPINNIL